MTGALERRDTSSFMAISSWQTDVSISVIAAAVVGPGTPFPTMWRGRSADCGLHLRVGLGCTFLLWLVHAERERESCIEMFRVGH
jgi:hypothetical protein